MNRETPDLDETRAFVDSIVKNGKRTGDVIRGIRALAMKAGPDLTEFDINGAILEVLALTRSDLQRHGSCFTPSFPLRSGRSWLTGFSCNKCC